MKPHIICHMMGPIDGQLLVDDWSPSTGRSSDDLVAEYDKVHEALDCDAWISGRFVGEEFADGQPHPPSDLGGVVRPVHVAREGADEYAILIDQHGKLHWKGPETYGAALIMVLGRDVSNAHLTGWRQQLEANFFSIVTAHSLFIPRMIAQSSRSAIVNLGSKEGITTPPGNAAYSVAKAGVKVLTEQLAHELREQVGDRITAHLFVPGYTWTPMNAAHRPPGSEKPDEAWTAGQLLAYFEGRFRHGDFYILCPDNAVTPELDARRILWAAGDIVEGRPALSRWHPDWKDHFAAYVRP